LRTINVDTQETGILGSGNDSVSNWYAARELNFAFCNYTPFAGRRASTERMPANNSQNSTSTIGHQATDRLTSELLVD